MYVGRYTLLSPATNKTKSFQSARNSSSPGVDAPRVHVRAWTRCCFHGFVSQYPGLWEAADSIGGQLRGDKREPSSGRVGRKVPESGARSVQPPHSAESGPAPDQRRCTAVVALSRQMTHLYVGVDCQRPRQQQQRRLPHVGSVPSHLLLHPGIDSHTLPAIIAFYSHALPAIVAS